MSDQVRIIDLPEGSTFSDGDYIVVDNEGASGTRKVPASVIPTSSGTNVVANPTGETSSTDLVYLKVGSDVFAVSVVAANPTGSAISTNLSKIKIGNTIYPIKGTYTLPTASSSNLGGIKTGYSESGNNYAVKVVTTTGTNKDKAYVTVPPQITDVHADGSILQSLKIDNVSYQIPSGEGGGTVVEANPASSATDSLYKLSVAGTVYTVNPMTTIGDLIVGSTDGKATKLSYTDGGVQAGYVLTHQGVGTPPKWVKGMTNPMTNKGDIVYGSTVNDVPGVPTRLKIGSEGDILTVAATGVPAWAAPATSLSYDSSTSTYPTTKIPTAGAILDKLPSINGLSPVDNGSGWIDIPQRVSIYAPASSTSSGGGSGEVLLSASLAPPTWLKKGRAGQVLTMNSGATAPEWKTLTVGTSVSANPTDSPSKSLFKLSVAGTVYTVNPMTAQGDIIFGGTGGVQTRLAKGTAGQILAMDEDGAVPTWSTLSKVALFTFQGNITGSGTPNAAAYVAAYLFLPPDVTDAQSLSSFLRTYGYLSPDNLCTVICSGYFVTGGTSHTPVILKLYTSVDNSNILGYFGYVNNSGIEYTPLPMYFSSIEFLGSAPLIVPT